MIEVTLSYDLLPNVDMNAYKEWVKKTVETMVKQPGVMEFRAHRNAFLLTTPQIRACTVWRSMEDWAKFEQGEVWHSIAAGFRGFGTNFKVELWGPSPLVAEPVRPPK